MSAGVSSLVDKSGQGYHENVPFQLKSKVVIAPKLTLETNTTSAKSQMSVSQTLDHWGTLKTSLIGKKTFEIDYNRPLYKEKNHSIVLHAGIQTIPVINWNKQETNQKVSLAYNYTGNTVINARVNASLGSNPYTYALGYKRIFMMPYGVQVVLNQKVNGKIQEQLAAPALETEATLKRGIYSFSTIYKSAKNNLTTRLLCSLSNTPRKDLLPDAIGVSIESQNGWEINQNSKISLYASRLLSNDICLNSCINTDKDIKVAMAGIIPVSNYFKDKGLSWFNCILSCSLLTNVESLQETSNITDKVKMGFKVSLAGDLSKKSKELLDYSLHNIIQN